MSPVITRLQRAVYLSLICAFLGACAESEDSPFLPGNGLCSSDFDCPSEQVCIASTCQPGTTKPSGEYYYSVEPNIRTGYVTTHFLPEDIEPNAEGISLLLPQPASFNYQVLSAAGERISASISVYGGRRIPGWELVHSETYLSSRNANLALVPDSYRIRFEPREGFAPGVDTEFTVRMSTKDKDFMLSSNYRRIEGIVHAQGDENTPISQVEVQAISQSARLPSSTAVTDNEGRFSIMLPDTKDTSFLVLAQLSQGSQPAWTYQQEIRVELEEDRNLNIAFPKTISEQRGEASIRFIGTADMGETPIHDAKVILTASTSSDIRSYRLEAKTDADGYVVLADERDNQEALALLATTYTIEIIPRRDSHFARMIHMLDLSGLAPDNKVVKTIALPKRVKVSGALLSYDATVIQNANINISYQGANTVFPSPGTNTSTDEFGNFNVWLDPGKYLVQATPPSSGNLSAQLPPAFIIADVLDAPEFALKPIIVSKGSRMTGELRGHDERVVSEAEVTPYIKVDNTVIQLDTVSVDDNGQFLMILPSE